MINRWITIFLSSPALFTHHFPSLEYFSELIFVQPNAQILCISFSRSEKEHGHKLDALLNIHKHDYESYMEQRHYQIPHLELSVSHSLKALIMQSSKRKVIFDSYSKIKLTFWCSRQILFCLFASSILTRQWETRISVWFILI